MSNSSPVQVGECAPAFTLPNQSGTPVNLADLLGQKPIVLYFYPKDDTPGCTAESCAFRDSYEIFQEAGAEVIGIGLSDFGENYQRSFFAQLVSTPILDLLIYSTGVANELAIRSFLEQRQFARPERVYPEMVKAYLEGAQQPNAEYSALSFVRGDLCFDLSGYIIAN